jgi:ubiquinone/menaquinone biosynthesis C-methylase UbiE
MEVVNIDVSETAVTAMNENLKKRKEEYGTSDALKRNRKKEVKKTPWDGFSYLKMNALEMNFPDRIFDYVLDKGTADALFSGPDAQLENAKVQALFKEVHRVLREEGTFLLISGNDSNTLLPYLYEMDWSVEMKPIHRVQSKRARAGEFSKLSIFLYVLRKARGST